MTVFWLIVAGALMLYSRFGTHGFKSDTLGQLVFNASQIAMLGCIGLAFFALFDQPSPSSSFAGPGRNFWPTLGVLGGGLVALVVAGMTIVGTLRRQRLGRSELTTPELTLRLDEAEGVVHINERGQLMTHRIPIGRLGVDVAPYENDSQKRAGLVFRQWPNSGKMSPETAARGVAEVVRMDVWADTARDVTAWLRRHPGIELDADVVRLKWQRTVDAMVRHAREQGSAGKKLALEAWVAYDGPALDYLAIGVDGHVVAGTGEETLVESVDRPLVSDGKSRVQVAVGDRFPVFALGSDQVTALQKLHAKGLVNIIQGQF
jgi:hypothetical protein